jgi:hypothetical protein
MTTRNHKALLAAAIAAMVVLPVAFAGAAGPGAGAKKQIKALSKRIAALEAIQAPTTLPPRGPAGGDLTGSYPNPQIGPSTVGSPAIADGAIGRADIGNDAISFDQIAPGAIGASELKSAVAVTSAGLVVNPGNTADVIVTCPAGTRLISGGPEWGTTNRDGLSTVSSSASFADPNGTWEVQGRVDTGGVANTLHADALCLSA